MLIHATQESEKGIYEKDYEYENMQGKIFTICKAATSTS